jgi:hypothetical protein
MLVVSLAIAGCGSTPPATSRPPSTPSGFSSDAPATPAPIEPEPPIDAAAPPASDDQGGLLPGVHVPSGPGRVGTIGMGEYSPGVDFDMPVVQGVIDAVEVRRMFVHRHSLLRACRGDPPITGRMTLELAVDTSGKITDVKTKGLPELSACVVKATSRITLPAASSASRVVVAVSFLP